MSERERNAGGSPSCYGGASAEHRGGNVMLRVGAIGSDERGTSSYVLWRDAFYRVANVAWTHGVKKKIAVSVKESLDPSRTVADSTYCTTSNRGRLHTKDRTGLRDLPKGCGGWGGGEVCESCLSEISRYGMGGVVGGVGWVFLFGVGVWGLFGGLGVGDESASVCGRGTRYLGKATSHHLRGHI